MKILFITSDVQFLEEKSERRALLEVMLDAADVLHVVVLSNNKKYSIQKLSPHGWVYPTNSWSSIFYFIDGLRVIRRQVLWKRELQIDIIISDNPFAAGWLGTLLARIYKRTWMINIHSYYWEKYFTMSLIERLTIVPISYIFKHALRIFSFSEKTSLYLHAMARTDATLHKIIPFPIIYDDKTESRMPEVRIKELYPSFDFILLTSARGGRLQTAINIALELRKRYKKAGLVVLGRSQGLAKFRATFLGTDEVVRFESKEEHVMSYLKTANVYLYFSTGEEEDEMLIRAAAASCPIVATNSVIAKKIIHHGRNGFIVNDAAVDTFVSAIITMNETFGMREQFKVNSGMYLHQQFVDNRSALVEKIKEYWSSDETKTETETT